MSSYTEKSWEEFQSSGLVWFINRTLHLFGWVLVFEMDEGEVTKVYPARTIFRGFTQDVEAEGYAKLTKHIVESIPEIRKAFTDEELKP